jgi:glutamate-1-semialdehyde aminotransferase
MVAALTTIHVLRTTDALSHIWKIGSMFAEGMRNLIELYGIPAEYTIYPPYPFIRFTLPDPYLNDQSKRVFFTCTSQLGVYFHPNRHGYISAAHTEADVQETLNVCDHALRAVQQFLHRSG